MVSLSIVLVLLAFILFVFVMLLRVLWLEQLTSVQHDVVFLPSLVGVMLGVNTLWWQYLRLLIQGVQT